MKFPISPEMLEQIGRVQSMIPSGLQETLKTLKPILDMQELLKPLMESFQRINEALNKHPELNFLRLLDDPELSEEEIERRLAVVEQNLPPILEKIRLVEIWRGANFALASRDNNNPEWIRHYFISVRILIETLIEDRLAPDEEVKKWDGFAAAMAAYEAKHKTVGKISRTVRIQYFTSRIDLGFLGEFTDIEIGYINAQYRKASKVHEASLRVEENEFNMLKLHIGTLIWLLAKITLLLEV